MNLATLIKLESTSENLQNNKSIMQNPTIRLITLSLTILLGSGGLFFSSKAQENNKQASVLFPVCINSKCGYINTKGNVVIEPQFEGAGKFAEGLASVATRTNGYLEGYIDEIGRIVIEPRFDSAREFSEGLAAVGYDQDKQEIKIAGKTYTTTSSHPSYKWGFIDKTGKMVVQPQYGLAGDFSEGLAAVSSNDKWGFIDKTGRVVIGFNFDYASEFSDGLSAVMLGNKFGYIDRTGKTVIKPKYTYYSDFSEGLARVRVGGKTIAPLGMSSGVFGKIRYIDRTGHTVIKLADDVDGAGEFSEGLASFEVQKQDGYLYCGYIDQTGRVVIEPQFGRCEDFTEGLAAILLNGKWHYIDKTGNKVFDAPFFLVQEFRNGLAWVQSGDDVMTAKYGYIDRTGKIVWKPTR